MLVGSVFEAERVIKVIFTYVRQSGTDGSRFKTSTEGGEGASNIARSHYNCRSRSLVEEEGSLKRRG